MNIPHSALEINGNDHTIDGNHFSDISYECGDCGAVMASRSFSFLVLACDLFGRGLAWWFGSQVGTHSNIDRPAHHRRTLPGDAPQRHGPKCTTAMEGGGVADGKFSSK